MSEPPTCPIAVCAGPDCARDRRSDFKTLLDELGECSVVKTKCMGVCHGPVAVIGADTGAPVVIERIRSSKQARAIRKFAHKGGTVPTRLRQVDKKKKRRKAIGRALDAVA